MFAQDHFYLHMRVKLCQCRALLTWLQGLCVTQAHETGVVHFGLQRKSITFQQTRTLFQLGREIGNKENAKNIYLKNMYQ